MPFRHAYLHGFASSSLSTKGQALRRFYQGRGLTFHLPDLNYPSFSRIRYSGMLEAIDRFDRQLDADEGRSRPWRFIGSSMGGYVAARWAELHPERVDRLLLLCPAFDFVARWPSLIGEQALATWEREGQLPLPGPSGVPVEVDYGLIEDARSHPTRPEVSCPTTIIHGTRDEVVSIELSRAYAATHDNVELIEVDDGHSLVDSLAIIEAHAASFLIDPEHTLYWDFFGPDAQGTAEHFRVHLSEFLVREDLQGCTIGVEAIDAGQAATWCRCREGLVAVIGRALRAQRVE